MPFPQLTGRSHVTLRPQPLVQLCTCKVSQIKIPNVWQTRDKLIEHYRASLMQITVNKL